MRHASDGHILTKFHPWSLRFEVLWTTSSKNLPLLSWTRKVSRLSYFNNGNEESFQVSPRQFDCMVQKLPRVASPFRVEYEFNMTTWRKVNWKEDRRYFYSAVRYPAFANKRLTAIRRKSIQNNKSARLQLSDYFKDNRLTFIFIPCSVSL